MVQSPSWEANWFAASHEIPCISQNPKVHYRTHNRPPPVSILGQPNPVHIPTSHLLEIHANFIHPSTPRSPQWSLSLRFPHQDPIRPLLLTLTRHMPSPCRIKPTLTNMSGALLYILLRRFRLVNDFRSHRVLLALISNNVIDSNRPTGICIGALCTPQRHVWGRGGVEVQLRSFIASAVEDWVTRFTPVAVFSMSIE